MADNAQGQNWLQDAGASTYSAPSNPYLDKLKSYADPAAYQKLMDALQYGGQSDIGAQIFTPLSPDVLKDVPKTIEPATDVSESGYVTPIGQNVPVGKSNGIPVYATYDEKGKLTGFSGDQTYRAWVNGQQSYGGQWDASGNAKPQQYTSKGGGFFKGLAGDLATSFGGYGPLLANLALPGSGTAISLANAALNGGDFSKTLQNLAISQAVGQSGLGGAVSDATESPLLGRLASGAASGVLRGQDLTSALTNSAIGAGVNAGVSEFKSPTSSDFDSPTTIPITSLEEDLSKNDLSSNDLFNSVISNQDTTPTQNGYYDEETGKFIPSEFGSPQLDDTSGTGTMEGWKYDPENQTWTSPDGTETDLSHLSNSQTPLDTSKLNDSGGSNFLTPSMLNNLLKYGGMAAGAGAVAGGIGSMLDSSGNPSIPNQPPVPLQNQTVNWNPQTGVSQDGVAYGLAQLQPTYTPSAAQGGIMSLTKGNVKRMAGGGVTGNGNLDLHIPINLGGGGAQGGGGYSAAGSGGGGYSGNQQNSLGVSNPQIPQRAFTGNQAQTQIQGAGPRGPANFDTGYLQTMQNVFGLPPNFDQRQQPFDMSHYEDGSAYQNFFNSYGPAATSNRFSQEYQKNQAQNAAQGLAAGGLTSGIASLGSYAAGGNPRLLRGPGDGMSDNIPATIAGKQPARLADGEFVVPADVVSHLGNGSTEAGANVLHQMMERVRKARTGNSKQGHQINPQKFIPSKGK